MSMYGLLPIEEEFRKEVLEDSATPSKRVSTLPMERPSIWEVNIEVIHTPDTRATSILIRRLDAYLGDIELSGFVYYLTHGHH